MSHCVEKFCSTMDGWEGNGSRSSSSRPRTAGVPVGVSKRSTKIAKNAKRSSGVLHQASRQQQQQQQQEAQPPPVYNINKSEFRNVVQRLTGSPVAEPLSVAPLASAEPPRGPSSRLQKMRPPPLSSLSAPPPRPRPPGGVATPPLFSPLPPLTPGDAVWANPAESPVSAYMRYLQQSMSNPSPRPPNHPLPSPSAQFLLPSPLPSPGPAFPFVGAYFTQSPSAQFGYPGAGSPLLPPPPPSPGLLFPLSPAGRFPASPAAGLGREGFSFPDRNRRL